MSDVDKLRQTVRGMAFDLDEFEKMLDAQNACTKEMVKTDEVLQKQLDTQHVCLEAQRGCLEELVNSVESLQRQIDSLKTRGRSHSTASPYMPQKLPNGRPKNTASPYVPRKLPRRI